MRDSIRVSGDGTAERPDGSRLRIGTTGDEDFKVRYVVADGRGGIVDVSVAVEVDEPCSSGGGDDGGGIPLPATGGGIPLPATGATILPWLGWLAVALLAAGGVLVVASRRRRTRASD